MKKVILLVILALLPLFASALSYIPAISQVPTVQYIQSPTRGLNILPLVENVTLHGQNLSSDYVVVIMAANGDFNTYGLYNVSAGKQSANLVVHNTRPGTYDLYLRAGDDSAYIMSNKIQVQIVNPTGSLNPTSSSAPAPDMTDTERQETIHQLQTTLIFLIQQLIVLMEQSSVSPSTDSTFAHKLPCSITVETETDLLKCVDEEAKQHLTNSIKIRSSYPAGSDYKQDLLTSLRDSSVIKIDSRGYFHFRPYGFYHYVSTSGIPSFFYRYVKDCTTKQTILRAVIDTSFGYENYTGDDRYQAQCINDGTMDTYYVESTTILE